MRFAELALAALGLLALAPPCVAHPYFPLHEGDVVVLDYRFHVETEKKEFALPERRGTMILTSEKTEEKNGKSWLRVRVSYRDLPDAMPDVLLWRREENGDVWVGAMHGDRWSETRELARDLEVGAEWDYDDGERSRRKVVRKVEMEVAGKTLSDCVEITRLPAKKELGALDNRNTYCAGVGEVKSYFAMPSPVGTYVTETTLRERRPAD